ncbi:hypothetical protein SAMN02982929_03246 [Saccharopolyspora kobensis]|uniref:DUF6895 domain-containing protein n=1 Tax=Saccharopolyspora kobensis TaxID=146035 RepID=A0A1H6C9B7_9PSEU|nr:hypothetical protein [Saccharopolyspora kobensis]SEG69561.1 hypothetical protein SAMN02982929_03246 [Saccharopolyspora kobensis]SFC32960.1 hypothetical protein SAMN05216506_101488 [Saccharopolyspora kobensis]
MSSPALLHRLGARIWEWLARHREHFRPRADDPVEALKPVGELAMAAAVLLREGVAGSQQDATARSLLEFAWKDLLDAGDVLERVQRQAPLTSACMEVYVHFHERGYGHPGLEETLRVLRPLRGCSAAEAVPHRKLGIVLAERRLGLSTAGDLDDALRATLLGRFPEPWTVDCHVAYAITHTVFYVTDWGAHPDRVPREIADYLDLWLPVWIDECLERRQWDLLGELLATDACLPRPALDSASWGPLAAAQAPGGALPATGDMPTGDAGEVFELVYHPTLVAAFATTLATSRALTALVTAP